jgi:hypothetical protein
VTCRNRPILLELRTQIAPSPPVVRLLPINLLAKYSRCSLCKVPRLSDRWVSFCNQRTILHLNDLFLFLRELVIRYQRRIDLERVANKLVACSS